MINLNRSAQTSRESYPVVKSFILKMIDAGLEDLDILVAANERFESRELVQQVLADLSKKGIL